MNPLRHSSKAVLVLLLLAVASLAAFADPPGRVARVQYVGGSVSVQPHGTDDWVEATLNRPLTNADNIWTDNDSRAELNVGTGVMRMNAMSSLTLTNVSDNTVQVQLHQGTLNLRIRHLWDGEIYEIDTPNFAFTIQKSGEYRFDVDPDKDASVVTVWKGEGDATGDGPAVRVHSKEQARFRNGNSLAHSIERAPGFDGFDDWCRVRDERLDHSYSARYVPRDTIGYEDLDDYGHWRVVEPYGPVWVPAVAPGWAPYSYGHWVWIDPWGWTWVDDAPWGFAPFHYGRWVYYQSYWGWVPGPYYVRPYYAPALVASPRARMAERHTRWSQTPLSERACWFESRSGHNPASTNQLLGPTKVSRSSTDRRRAMEMFLGLVGRYEIPSWSQASQKIILMSADAFVKKYRV